jgi:hypothetical protein
VQPRAASWFEPAGQAEQPGPVPGSTAQAPLDRATAGDLEAVAPPATALPSAPRLGGRGAAARSGGTPVRASSPSPHGVEGGTLAPPVGGPTAPGRPAGDGSRAPEGVAAPVPPAGPSSAPTARPPTTTPAWAGGEHGGPAEAERGGEGELGAAEGLEVRIEAVGRPDGRIPGAPVALARGPGRSLPRRLRPAAADPETQAAGPWTSRAPAGWPLSAASPPSGTPHGDGGTPAEAPSIHVTIGRVEVRATPSPAARPARRRQAPGAITLDEYLRRQDERRP